MKNNLIQKLEQGRAEFAYKCVKEAVEKSEKGQKEYKSYAKKIPQMILSNGLGQTIAFIYSKCQNSDTYKLIYDQIGRYLKSEATSRIKINENEDLISWIISHDSDEYRYLTQEVLAFFNWLRRFAEGMIEGDEEQ